MAASRAQPFEVNDFSGGITDHVFEQNMVKSANLDNFLIGHDHKPYTRFGSELDDATNARVPGGARIDSLINYANSDNLFYQTGSFVYYRNPSSFSELVGTSGNHAFSTGTSTSVASFAQWNRHLYFSNDAYSVPMKAYKDGSGNYQIRNAGLPDLSATPVVTAGAAGDGSYIYGFHYSYSYTVFDLQYESIGPVTLVPVNLSEAPDVANIAISALPVLTNGSTDNYDLANLKIQIYRTTKDGTFLYKVGEIANGTTTFSDPTSDTVLQNTGTNLYTNDGTVDFDPVPLHKFCHVVNNTGYYAYIKNASGESPYKIRQSIPGVPDTAPIDFEVSVDDQITGLSSVRNIPIVLCKKYIYRIDQSFDQFGTGNMVPVRISDTAGCISNNSCVQAENGLFWLGNEGVWFSDGYQTQRISDLSERYKDIIKNTTQANRTVGRYFEKERLIIWAIQTDSANQDNDAFFILDLKWGISDSCTFTTWSGRSFRPTALEIFNNYIYRGDVRGFALKHDDSLTVDKKIDLSKDPSTWSNETIIWQIKTIHYNFGGTFFRKYPTRILITASDAGNTTIQINAINDDGKSTRYCKPIRIRRDLIWRDDDFSWRQSDIIWRGSGVIEQWRRFPAKSLRLSTLQLVITNGYSAITNSDTLGGATFNSFAKTVTMDSSSKWPVDSEDYYISSDVDNYTKEFLIDNRVSDSVLSVADPLAEMPNSSQKWVIRGYKKAEPLYLLGFNIHWTNVSASQDTYSSSTPALGENA